MGTTIIEQPSIEVFGILLQEPVTTLTDLLVSIICFYAYWKLKKHSIPGGTIFYMNLYFLFMGLGTAFGGLIGHGFQYLFSENWKILGWFISMFSIMLIERSAIIYAKHIIKPALGKLFLQLNIFELVVMMGFAAYTLDFKFVEFHCVYGLLVVVFSFHLYTYIKTKSMGSRYVLQAIVILAAAMFIYDFPIVLHAWFNHHDLAHVIMAFSSILLIKAAIRMKDNPEIKYK